jgi:hypothetical protein
MLSPQGVESYPTGPQRWQVSDWAPEPNNSEYTALSTIMTVHKTYKRPTNAPCFFLCFVDRASRYMRVMKPT